MLPGSGTASLFLTGKPPIREDPMDRTLTPADIAHYDPRLAELSTVPASHGRKQPSMHPGSVISGGQRSARLPNARPGTPHPGTALQRWPGSAQQRWLEAVLRP
jgi:hypothetical protein